MISFEDFSLSDELMNSVREMGYETPTPIQQQVIPLLLTGPSDLIGLAHTGTGKTAAFVIPVLEQIDTEKRFTQACIIAPTRELVKQIETQVQAFGKYKRSMRALAIYGGASITQQMQELKKAPQILIATPGRILDLIKRKYVNLKDVRFMVLDEADEMLNMGFKEDIDAILSSVEGPYNTWLFSATFPPEIRRIAKEYMHNPVEVAVDSIRQSNADISHKYCVVKGSGKTEMLKRLLETEDDLRGIVFCRTKKGTQSLADELKERNYKVDALHGDLSQAQRERVMKRFRSYQLKVLIATDVAARGIDVKDLTHIIHYDLPDDIAFYTHRSGRTGRAGKKGLSVVFVPPSQQRRIHHLEKVIKIKFEQLKVPDDREILLGRLRNKAVELVQIKEPEYIEAELKESFIPVFQNLTREEILEKLLVSILKRYNYQGMMKNSQDAPQGREMEAYDHPVAKTHSNRSKRTERTVKKEVDTSQLVNFFINIGSMDGIGKNELIRFLSDHSKIESEYFRNLNISEKHAFFDAPKELENKIIHSFKEISVGNRKLRVNRNN